jgi:hypothetical protein
MRVRRWNRTKNSMTEWLEDCNLKSPKGIGEGVVNLPTRPEPLS